MGCTNTKQQSVNTSQKATPEKKVVTAQKFEIVEEEGAQTFKQETFVSGPAERSIEPVQAVATIPKPPVGPPPEGRQGYVRAWREVDEWFDMLDDDKDDKLNQEEATEYIRDFLKRTQGTDPQDALIEMEFVDMATEGFLSKQCLYDHIV